VRGKVEIEEERRKRTALAVEGHEGALLGSAVVALMVGVEEEDMAAPQRNEQKVRGEGVPESGERDGGRAGEEEADNTRAQDAGYAGERT